MSESFLTRKWKCPKLREKLVNFGYDFSNSSWQNAAKGEIKIQVTFREIFATFFTEKGLNSLLPKNFLQIEIKTKPYKTQQEVRTHFTRNIRRTLKDMERYLILLIIREMKTKTLKHHLSPTQLANTQEGNSCTLLAGLRTHRPSTLGCWEPSPGAGTRPHLMTLHKHLCFGLANHLKKSFLKIHLEKYWMTYV